MNFNEKNKSEQPIIIDALQEIYQHKIVKIIFWGGVVVGLVFVSGLIMRVAAGTVNNFKELKSAMNK